MFSVLISLYNKEKPENLEQCLESLHQQTLNADEIVLVYDGPVSESLKAVATRWANLLPLVIVPLEKTWVSVKH